MANCKYCTKRGWLLTIDNNGLCDNCQVLVLPQIVNHCRIVMESDKLIQNSKKVETRLSRIEVARRSLEALREYDGKGIPTLTMKPQAIIQEYQNTRTHIIEEYVREQVFMARQKATDASTDAAKLGGYAKAVERISKIMDETEDVSALEEAVLGLRAERDNLRFDLKVKKAEAAIAKGKPKPALDLYIDALLELSHDATPDDWQSDKFEKARARIIDLDGVPEFIVC